jgi:hypothetical protein
MICNITDWMYASHWNSKDRAIEWLYPWVRVVQVGSITTKVADDSKSNVDIVCTENFREWIVQWKVKVCKLKVAILTTDHLHVRVVILKPWNRDRLQARCSLQNDLLIWRCRVLLSLSRIASHETLHSYNYKDVRKTQRTLWSLRK